MQETRCKTEVPELRKLGEGHVVACHWAEDIKAGRIQPKEVKPVFDPGVVVSEEGPPPV